MNRLIVGDLNETYRVDLNKKQMLIGRMSDCDIVLKSNSVSRTHAKIYLKESLWFLEDLNSTNGVYVNNTKIDTPLALMHKDLIKIGESTLEFIDEEFEALDGAADNIAADFHRHHRAVKPVTLNDLLKGVNDAKNKLLLLSTAVGAGQTSIPQTAESIKTVAGALAALIRGFIQAGSSSQNSVTMVQSIESKLKYDGISQLLEAAASGHAKDSKELAGVNANYLFALDEIKAAAATASDYKKSCYLILSIAMKILGLNRGFIIIKDPASGDITPIVSKINKSDMAESSPSMAIARYTINKNHAVFVNDPARDERFVSKSASIVGGVIKSVVCVPFSKKSICLGAIYLDSDEQQKQFSEMDRDFVIKLTGYISELLEMSGIFHELVSEYEGIDEILAGISKKSELEELLKKIIMADVKTKIDAIEKVVALNDETVIEVLKENMAGVENRFLLATYIKIIGTIAKENDIEFVKKYLLHPDSRVRANAIGALMNMKARERALNKIVKMTKDEDQKVRALATHYILSLNHNLLISEFEKYLSASNDDELCDAVIDASFLMGLDAVETLYQKTFGALNDRRREMVAARLSELGDEKAKLILERLQKTVAAARSVSKAGVVPAKPAKAALAQSIHEIKKEVREKVNPVSHSYESDDDLDDDILAEFRSALQRVNENAKSENQMKAIMYQLKIGKKK